MNCSFLKTAPIIGKAKGVGCGTKTASTTTRNAQRTRLLLTAIVLTTLLVGCAIGSITEPRRFDPAQEPTLVPTSVAVSKPTYTVARGTVTRGITLSGRVVPITEASLSFSLAGTVGELFVEREQAVAAGDLLARLDMKQAQTDLILAQSALSTAQARLTAVTEKLTNDRRRAEIAREAAQLRLDYARTQAGSNPSPDEALNIQLLTLDVELADLALSELTAGADPGLQAAVAEAQLRVDELTAVIAAADLVAPWDGVVIRANVEPGQLLAAGETAVVLADLSQLEVQSVVNDSGDMDSLVEGMPVTIKPASRPGEAIAGLVGTLPIPYGSSETLPESTIRIAFTNPTANPLGNSDRVTVDLVLAESPDTLWLLPSAVRDFNGRHFVVIQDGDTQRRVDVILGLESNGRVELLEGVEEGQTIIGQ